MLSTAKNVYEAEEEQLLHKLESAIELYKTCRHGVDELDKLTFLIGLRDIRNLLYNIQDGQRLQRKQILDFEKLVKGLNSQLKNIALKELFRELDEVKLRVGKLERKIEEKNSVVKLPLYRQFEIRDEDETWQRITARRKEILGGSSLRLLSTIPPRKKHVRFNLGTKAPGKHEKSAKENCDGEHLQEKSLRRRKVLFAPHQLAKATRDNRLQEVLKQRRERSSQTKRVNVTNPKFLSSKGCLILLNKDSCQKTRQAPEEGLRVVGNMPQGTQQETAQKAAQTGCKQCRKLLKERDQFWGLESDSEDDNNDVVSMHGRDDGLQLSSMAEQQFAELLSTGLPSKKTGSKIRGVINLVETDTPFNSRPQKAFVIKHKPWGIAGRGTWATPATVPPLTVVKVERKAKRLTEPDRLELQRMRFRNTSGIST